MPEKILIIDDDLDTLRLVGLMLQKQGYQIAAANNGEQGLVKVMEENPDLILLDVMMPEMDGYEVARRLRENPQTAGIPILMFTAKSQLDDKVTGFESGADDYLTKPTHPAELQAHVKALLARSSKAPQAEKTAPLKKRAFVVGVIGARGGLGVSSITLNLATFLHSEEKLDTLIAELTPGMGTIGRDLGFDDLDDLTELLKRPPEKITSEGLKEMLKEHKSGIKLLLATESPKDFPHCNNLPQFEALFSSLVTSTDYLLLDFGASLPLFSQKLLPHCDHLIVVSEAFPNVIAHTKLLIEDILSLGVPEENISIVLNNRIRSDLLLSMAQVEKLIGAHISVTFTPAPELYAQARRMKSIAILLQPESITKQQFKNLSNLVKESKAKKA